jgi:hypothetical protein
MDAHTCGGRRAACRGCRLLLLLLHLQDHLH